MLGMFQCGGGVVSELFRSPVVVLRRELDWLRARLKEERAEVRGLEARLGVERSVGLARLVDVVQADVDRTAALVSEYKKAIRALGGG